MPKRELNATLDADSIDRVIGELRAYKTRFRNDVERFLQAVAKQIATNARDGFAGSQVDILTEGRADHSARATVTVEGSGNSRLVVASGEDVIWCEFGTGVYFNGSAGSSPHPKGAELGYTIGGYGIGNGKRAAWRYQSGAGIVETHGTPATMPLYKAFMKVLPEIGKIANGVFG